MWDACPQERRAWEKKKKNVILEKNGFRITSSRMLRIKIQDSDRRAGSLHYPSKTNVTML